MKKFYGILLAAICSMLLIAPQTALADAASGGGYNFQQADFAVVVDAPDNYVNMRYGPGLEYPIICPIYNGEILHIDTTADNYNDGLWWGQIYYGGKYGWISLSQSTILEEVPEPEITETSQYVVVSASDGYCNLRENAGISYNIITPIYNGQILYVSLICYNPSDGLTWGYTNYNGMTGWISMSQTSEVKPEETTAAPAPAPTPTPEPDTKAPSPETPAPGEELVKEVYRYESPKANSLGDYIYSIPAIQLSGDDITKINQEIYTKLYTLTQTAIVSLNSEDSLLVEFLSSSYEWYVNGDVLSLVIYTSYFGPWHEYDVYNVSISTGMQLDNAAVYQTAGFTDASYNEKAAKVLDLNFWAKNARSASTSGKNDLYYELKQKTCSQENVDAAKPFLNQDGQLCIVGCIYLYLMQNNSSWEILNLENSGLDSGYFVMVDASDNYCNFRKGPGLGYDIITEVYNGTVLHISESQIGTSDGLNWGKTEYAGEEGWVSLSQTTTVVPE